MRQNDARTIGPRVEPGPDRVLGIADQMAVSTVDSRVPTRLSAGIARRPRYPPPVPRSREVWRRWYASCRATGGRRSERGRPASCRVAPEAVVLVERPRGQRDMSPRPLRLRICRHDSIRDTALDARRRLRPRSQAPAASCPPGHEGRRAGHDGRRATRTVKRTGFGPSSRPSPDASSRSPGCRRSSSPEP